MWGDMGGTGVGGLWGHGSRGVWGVMGVQGVVVGGLGKQGSLRAQGKAVGEAWMGRGMQGGVGMPDVGCHGGWGVRGFPWGGGVRGGVKGGVGGGREKKGSLRAQGKAVGEAWMGRGMQGGVG